MRKNSIFHFFTSRNFGHGHFGVFLISLCMPAVSMPVELEVPKFFPKIGHIYSIIPENFRLLLTIVLEKHGLRAVAVLLADLVIKECEP